MELEEAIPAGLHVMPRATEAGAHDAFRRAVALGPFAARQSARTAARTDVTGGQAVRLSSGRCRSWGSPIDVASFDEAGARQHLGDLDHAWSRSTLSCWPELLEYNVPELSVAHEPRTVEGRIGDGTCLRSIDAVQRPSILR